MKRRFISIFTFTLLITFFLSSCAKNNKKANKSETHVYLGTVCTINAYEDGTDDLYNLIFTRLEELENKFSVNIPESQISKINRNAGEKSVQIDEEVYFVLKTAKEFADYTNGAFDPTVGPLVKLWGINTDKAKVPAQNEIDEALLKIDWKKLELRDDSSQKDDFYSAYLTEKEMNLDLGGIAKGYACDQIVEILKENKVSRAIVDLGGNIFVFGSKPDGNDWVVGIKNPLENTGNPILGVKTKQGTVVTSGNYQRLFVENGKIYHHILSTKNGFPVDNGIVSVSIVTEKSILADVLSTSLFVLGKEKGFDIFEKLISEGILNSESSVVFIENDGTITASKNLSDKISMMDSEKIIYR